MSIFQTMSLSATVDLSGLGGDQPIDDEGLFARDLNGQLVRLEEATASELAQKVTLTIDGVQVTVQKAVPTLDSQGKVVRDAAGNPIPRPTTIHDAAALAFVKSPGQKHPIPTLCHREHLPPVGVCRVCMVEATEMTRRGPRSKLVPSCIQRVTDGMIVHTVASDADPQAAARAGAAASTVVELLLADHAPAADSKGQEIGNELLDVAERLGVDNIRFGGRDQAPPADDSSMMIAVNHAECISCGRCSRSCDVIKNNHVHRSGGQRL